MLKEVNNEKPRKTKRKGNDCFKKKHPKFSLLRSNKQKPFYPEVSTFCIFVSEIYHGNDVKF